LHKEGTWQAQGFSRQQYLRSIAQAGVINRATSVVSVEMMVQTDAGDLFVEVG